jgi:hypothetical protein
MVGRYQAPPPIPSPISAVDIDHRELQMQMARTNSRMDRIEAAQRESATKVTEVANQQERIFTQLQKNDDILSTLVQVMNRLSAGMGSPLDEESEMT